jgi:NCS1 family nucleobase:cation symporter-1
VIHGRCGVAAEGPHSRSGASALKGDLHEEANVGRPNCWLTEIRERMMPDAFRDESSGLRTISVLPQAAADAGSPLEAHSIDYIPRSERQGRIWHQGVFWFLGNFNPVTLAIGFLGPQLSLSLWWTVVASALGLIAGTAFMAFHASQGPRLGLPQMIQSRAQFGYRGAVLTLVLAFLTLMTFCVLNVLFVENGLKSLYGYPRALTGVLATTLAVTLAILGYSWIHRVFRITFFISLPLWLTLTVGALLGDAGGNAHAATAGDVTLVGFMTMFSVAASYNLASAPLVSDYSRYLPRDTPFRSVVAAVYIGAVTSALWLIALGAWLGSRLGTTDPLVAINNSGNHVVAGLGTVTTMVSCIALVAVTAIAAYSAGLVLITGVDSFHRFRLTRELRIGTLIILAITWGVVSIVVFQTTTNALSNALNMILYVLTPWTAINLVDYFFVRRGRYSIMDLFSPAGLYRSWKWQGLVSYAVAIAVMVPFMASLTFYTGPLAKSLDGVDITFFVGLLLAGSLYFLLARRGRDSAAEEAAINRSDSLMAQL